MTCCPDHEPTKVSRRSLMRAGPLAAIVGSGALDSFAPSFAQAAPARRQAPAFASDSDFLAAAKSAALWIDHAKVAGADGLSWHPEPDHPEKLSTVSPSNALYSGNAGIILFFVQLARANNDPAYLQKAVHGADHLVATWQNNLDRKNVPDTSADFSPYSLYFGLSGIAFALNEVAKASGQAKYRGEAIKVTDRIVRDAKPTGAGIAWSNFPGVTGDSGTILYLLYAAEAFSDGRYLAAAAKAGDRLLELAVPGPKAGWVWYAFAAPEAGAKNPNLPGFLSGAAGVAYTLARLFAKTRERKYLVAAEQGAAYLESIASVRGNAALIPYQLPDHADLHYLGWCHGAAGTARTFFELYRITGNPRYKTWTERLAEGIIQSEAPQNRAPGYWNVVNQCCGNGAFTSFFLGLWAAWGDAKYLEQAQRSAINLISRGTNFDSKGMRWDMSLTRVKPSDVTAETGYSVGAAGIGCALLHVHLANEDRYSALLLPDNPFPSGGG